MPIKKWIFRVFILVLSFSGSTYVAYYLSGRTFSLGELRMSFPQTEQGAVEPLAPDVALSPQVTQESEQVSRLSQQTRLTARPPTAASGGNESHQFSCVDLSAGAITRVPDTSVYRWVDDDGQIHYADREPDSAMLAEVIGLGSGRDQYFDLDIQTLNGQLSTNIRRDIELRANKAYEILSGLVSELQRNKVALNVVLIDGRSTFESYAVDTGYLGAANAAGFYRMANNRAVVLQQVNPERTLAIATHESVHVINAGLYGAIPRWLNEGLADYLEDMNISGQVVEIRWQSKWSGHTSAVMSVAELVAATPEDWDGPNRNRLYASSRAFVYFLIGNPSGKRWISDFFTLKSGRVCDRISEQPFFNLHFGSVVDANSQFQNWLRGSSQTVHLY